VPSTAPLKVKSLLVTGGTGFVGNSVLDAFGRGLLKPFGVERVIVLSRHARRLRDEAPELCGTGVELVDDDVLRLDSTFDADLLIHAAASSDAQRYRIDPVAESRTIVEGTRRVCEVVRAARRRPRLVYLSSGAVYGRQPAETVALREDAPQVAETDPQKASYTQAKRDAELLVCDVAAESGIRARIARGFAFVGPWLPRDTHFAIGNFLGNALRGEPIEVRARHTVVRSYMHADDLATWLLHLGTAPGEGCGIFNGGSPEAVSLRELAALVAAKARVDVSFPSLEREESNGAAERIDRYLPDVRKARDELGLSITIPLEKAVDQTLQALAAGRLQGSSTFAGESVGASP
jgi:dTDP-glucose 4,6-dehydratase